MNAYGVVHTKYAKQIKGSGDKNVDSYKCLWAFIGCYTRFSGLQSSLGITNGNRSHTKPLELN